MQQSPQNTYEEYIITSYFYAILYLCLLDDQVKMSFLPSFSPFISDLLKPWIDRLSACMSIISSSGLCYLMIDSGKDLVPNPMDHTSKDFYYLSSSEIEETMVLIE